MSMIKFSEYPTSNPKNVAMPDWSLLNVVSVKTVEISFDDIFIDDVTQQETKVESHTAEEIETLRLSLATGVDTNEFPPAVVFRGYGYARPYKLVYGYGRSEAAVLGGAKSWLFTVLEGSAHDLEDVQAAENEGYPKRLNKLEDMVSYLSKKIRQGRISNNEKAIKGEFRRIYSGRKTEICNRVTQMVMASNDTPQPFILYTSKAKVESWIVNHSSETIAVGGELDESRDMIGVQVKEGYQWRAVGNAKRRYRKTGKFTYIVGHVMSPSGDKTVDEKRSNFLAELEELRQDAVACGETVFPIRVLGFLPQVKGQENLKVLVDPQQYAA